MRTPDTKELAEMLALESLNDDEVGDKFEPLEKERLRMLEKAVTEPASPTNGT